MLYGNEKPTETAKFYVNYKYPNCGIEDFRDGGCVAYMTEDAARALAQRIFKDGAELVRVCDNRGYVRYRLSR